MKICPMCKIPKELSDFDTYWCKARNKHRPQSYCRDCYLSEKGRKAACDRAKKIFNQKRDEKLQYAKDYRANPENKEKLTNLSRKFKIKYRKELKDCYVADQISRKIGVKSADVRNHLTLIEDYRATLKLKRLIKKRENEK